MIFVDILVGLALVLLWYRIIAALDRRIPVMGRKNETVVTRCTECGERLPQRIILIGATRCPDCQEKYMRDAGRFNGYGGKK